MPQGDADLERLIRGLRDGDPQALGAFFRRYRPAIERLAERRIQPGMRRRFGAETIAQSVCRTFMRRARQGDFEIVNGDALWGLLCAIALTKVRENTRYHLRQKRGVDLEVPIAGRVEHTGRTPSPEGAVTFADELEHVISTCDEEERRVMELRLEDRSQQEIAEELRCSRRTVRRILTRLEARLRNAFTD